MNSELASERHTLPYATAVEPLKRFLKFKLRKFADMFILIVMMVPTQASAIGFYQFMNKLGWTDTYIPLIIPAVAAPATYYFMKQYMASALPLEIVEAARIDGCGEFKTFNKIVTNVKMI